ncbi:MAG: HPF/RaiA family ribosome-associated protein [Gemmatimonadota bacterium]
MRTTITTRHCEISEELKGRTEAIVERLGHLAQRAVECTVLFESDHKAAMVEVRLHAARGKMFVAHGEGPDHRSALDRAEEKLRNQLDKAAVRPRARKARADQA